MSRPFYSDYVRHAMRFYSRNSLTVPSFKTDVDKENWWACHKVMSQYPMKTKQILLSVYSGYDTLPDEVYNASRKWHIDQNEIWDLMKEIERKIALKRGLM